MKNLHLMVKKIGNIWVSKNTISKHFPKDCIVEGEIAEIKMTPHRPFILKKDNNSTIKYEIYSDDKNAYKKYKTKLQEEDR